MKNRTDIGSRDSDDMNFAERMSSGSRVVGVVRLKDSKCLEQHLVEKLEMFISRCQNDWDKKCNGIY